MSWELFVKIEYLSYLSRSRAFALFFRSLFSNDFNTTPLSKGFNTTVLRIVVAVSVVCSLVVLTTPVIIFSFTSQGYQLFTIWILSYGFYVVLRETIRKREGAIFILAGYSVLFIAIINDILDVNEIVQTGHMLGLGLFGFILSHALLLSFRYSSAFRIIDLQRQDLERTNIRYRNEMIERRLAEEEALELQSRLARSQKMEAIGRLAGGISHDFNNLLTSIMVGSELVWDGLRRTDPLRKEVEDITAAAYRGASLTAGPLSFSRQRVLQPEVLHLDAVVTGVEKVLRRVMNENIELVRVPDEGRGCVNADPGQVESLILNLAVNVGDSMPKGGTLTIKTADVDLDEDYCNRRVDARPGPYVVLVMTDTGSGMDAETQSHIFEPFFTTKEKGKGTGLGLSTVCGFVKQSGGHIEVDSDPGRGTSFRIYLPRVDEAVGKATTSSDL